MKVKLPQQMLFAGLVLGIGLVDTVSGFSRQASDSTTTLSQAERLFQLQPRTTENVSRALNLLEKPDPGNDVAALPFEFYASKAKYMLWLALHQNAKDKKAQFASGAKRLSEAAVKKGNTRVEGYYYRAVATGIYTEIKQAQARQAMVLIRRDALQAIKIDEHFDHGGPHRLLGALHLRAPGPPTGIGSKRQALKHLEKAYALAPDYPDNMLFLAEIYIELKQYEKADSLIKKALQSNVQGDFTNLSELRTRAVNLQNSSRQIPHN